MEAASAVIGIIDFSLKTATGIIGYTKQVKNAGKDLELLTTETVSLQQTLLRAKKLITNPNSATDNWTPINENTFKPYLEQLRKLEEKLQKPISRFRFPFLSSGFKKDADDVQKFRNTVDTEILIKLMAQGELNKKRADRNELYELLSPSDYSQRHNDLQTKRHGETGKWFIEGDNFKRWGNVTSLLWMYGIPGCGKSVLASRVIDAVTSRCDAAKAENLGIAYFYFDFNAKENRQSTKMIRSIMWQLASRSPKANNVMASKLDGYLKNKSQPSDSDLLKCLDAMLKEFKENFIIIDALDECEEEEKVMKAVQQIAACQHNLRLLLTSRRKSHIERTIHNLKIDKRIVRLEGAGVINDIKQYIRYRLQYDQYYERWSGDKKTQMMIEEKLVERADVMFRWVECQLIVLREFCDKDENGEKLRRLLNTLPDTLDETYERILQSVVPLNRQKTLTLLRWLCFSGRPLTVREVIEAMYIDENIDKLSLTTSKGFISPSDILNLCPGMTNTIVTTGENLRITDGVTENDEIKLSHFSVKEYLRSIGINDRKVSFFSIQDELTNSYLARACLLYMVQFDGISVTEKTSEDHPLATYSAQYWSMHARVAALAIQFDSTLEKQIDQLFASSTKLLAWVRLCNPDHEKPQYDALIDDIASPLYLASICGLSRQVKSLIAQGGNVEIEGGYNKKPLAAACRKGFASTAEILLDAGANFVSGKDDTVMIEATTSGKVEVVQLLLARERAAAEINEGMPWPICHIEALNLACMLGFTDIIEEFVVKNDGTDVNDMTADDCRQVLQIAAAHGRSETVEQLLDLGANIDTEGGWYGTALRAASLNGHESVVKILLKKGADPKLHGGSPGSALGAAIFFDRTSIFDLILRDGRIDVNNNEGMYGSLLQEAASKGSLEFVRKLLDKGAKVNAEGGLFHTALQAASLEGHEKIVELLLARGARPNDPEEGPADVVCVTPSDEIGHDIILLPFEKAGLKPYEWNGADFVRMDRKLTSERLSEVLRTQPSVTIQKGICGSALRAAAIAGHGDIVKCLLNAGATFDEQYPALQSVLKRAPTCDDQEIELVMKILANKKPSNSKTGYRMVEMGQTRAEDYMEGDRSDSVHGSLLEIGSFEKHPRMWVKLCF